jgi:hypothetical protein
VKTPPVSKFAFKFNLYRYSKALVQAQKNAESRRDSVVAILGRVPMGPNELRSLNMAGEKVEWETRREQRGRDPTRKMNLTKSRFYDVQSAPSLFVLLKARSLALTM